jgi:hypothetical protein
MESIFISAAKHEIVKQFSGHWDLTWEMDITASDWGRKDLIFYQIRQASISAYVSFKIGKDLRACQCVSIWQSTHAN